jgi:hypothetical protein
MQVLLVRGEPPHATFPAKFAEETVEIDPDNFSETPSPYGYDPPGNITSTPHSAPPLAVPRKPPDPILGLGASELKPLQHGALPLNKPGKFPTVTTTNVNNHNIVHNNSIEKHVDSRLDSYVKLEKQTKMNTDNISNNPSTSHRQHHPAHPDANTLPTWVDTRGAYSTPGTAIPSPSEHLSLQSRTGCDVDTTSDDDCINADYDSDDSDDSEDNSTAEDLLDDVEDTMEDLLIYLHELAKPPAWERDLVLLLKKLMKTLNDQTSANQMLPTVVPILEDLTDLAFDQEDIPAEAFIDLTRIASRAASKIQHHSIPAYSPRLNLQSYSAPCQPSADAEDESFHILQTTGCMMNDSLVTESLELKAINDSCQLPLHPDGLDDPGLHSEPFQGVDEELLHDANKTEPSECHSSPASLNLPVPYTTAPTLKQLNSDNLASLARLWAIVQAAPEVNDPPPSYYTMGPSLMDHLSKFFLDVSAQAPNTWATYYLPGPDGYMVYPYFKFAPNEELLIAQVQEAIFADPLKLSQPSGGLDAMESQWDEYIGHRAARVVDVGADSVVANEPTSTDTNMTGEKCRLQLR